MLSRPPYTPRLNLIERLWKFVKHRDCSIATGADSKIARQEQGESTWDPLNASELAPNSANGLIPSLIAWAKSQPPGNVAIVSKHRAFCGRYQPTFAQFQAAIQEVLGGLSTTHTEKLESLMTLKFQRFEDASLMAA